MVMSKTALRGGGGRERRTRKARFEFPAASRAQFCLFGLSVLLRKFGFVSDLCSLNLSGLHTSFLTSARGQSPKSLILTWSSLCTTWVLLWSFALTASVCDPSPAFDNPSGYKTNRTKAIPDVVLGVIYSEYLDLR